MKDRSTLVLITAVLFYSMTILATADAMSGATGEDVCVGMACMLVRFVRDFQTIIAAGIAAGAAWYAGRPVWLQLKNMNAQHDILARTTIVERLAGIEERARFAEMKTTAVVQDGWWGMYGGWHDEDGYDPNAIDAIWADNAERAVLELTRELRHHQIAKNDTSAIEQERTALIASAKAYGDCLASVSAPGRWVGDPEMTEEREKTLDEEAAKARIDLPGVVNLLDDAKKRFTKTARREIEGIKQRVRNIDDAILTRSAGGD
ncbi:hypothetical protein [Mesorhizobium sp. M0129]|uniref:hypothetical protein n=1 Tax=Mesorhizobium sp. M0129 TaxID=2956886 RepID=UPI0033393A12